MKVICIKEGFYNDPAIPRITVGCEYTVKCLHEQTEGNTTCIGYILVEMGDKFSYGRWNFAPISDIDEKEFERNYIKETINQ